MHVALVNQFFPPAQAPTGKLLNDLADLLVRHGHRVTVLASPGGYGNEQADSSPGGSDNIKVVRVGPRRAHQNGIWAKLVDYLSFFRRAGHVLSQVSPAPEVVVCMTTPPFCGMIGWQQFKRRETPYILWCMDLYPEALVANRLLGERNPIYWILRKISERERGHAARIISLGPDMTRRLASAGSACVEEIPVWSSLVVTPDARAKAGELRRQRGWADDEVILLYSGNMGRAHRIDEFVALAEHIKRLNFRARVVFSGIGPQLFKWKKNFASLFEFIPPAAPDEVTAHLLSADVHLVSQQPEWTGVVVPSKFQAACAVGRPVIFAGPKESAVGTWVQEDDTGWIITPGDSDGLEEVVGEVGDTTVRQRKGELAAGLFTRRFTREINGSAIVSIIERTADKT